MIAGVRDFNGDGKSDLLWYNTVTGVASVWPSGVEANYYTLWIVAPSSGWVIPLQKTLSVYVPPVSAASLAPPAPTGLKITASTATTMTLTWASGGGSTAAYQIAIGSPSNPPACTTGPAIGNVTSYTISNLTSGTQYEVTLCAVNSYGKVSPQVNVIGSTVATLAAPPAPTKFAVSSDSSSEPGTYVDFGWWNDEWI